MKNGGDYSDVRLCSCGSDWDDCKFWGDIKELNGLVSDSSIKEKYVRLIDYIGTKYEQDKIIVDSSKRFDIYRTLSRHREELGIREKDFLVVMMVKDVRNFTASIHSKKGAKRSLLSYRRTFNWWYGENRRLLEYFGKHDLNFITVLYEKFCNQPKEIVNSIFKSIGVSAIDELDLGHGNSHIAMGNKDFVMQNKERICYDHRWFLEDGIQSVYLLSGKVRHFNKRLYQS